MDTRHQLYLINKATELIKQEGDAEERLKLTAYRNALKIDMFKYEFQLDRDSIVSGTYKGKEVKLKVLDIIHTNTYGDVQLLCFQIYRSGRVNKKKPFILTRWDKFVVLESTYED